MSHPLPAELHVGDWVKERNRSGVVVANAFSPNFKTVSRILSHQRVGRIVAIETRKVAGGRNDTYVKVLWDYAATPSLHARYRIEKLPHPPAVDTPKPPHS